MTRRTIAAAAEGIPICNALGGRGQMWYPGCHTFYFDPNEPDAKPVMISGNPPGPPPPPPPPCIPLVNCLPGL